MVRHWELGVYHQLGDSTWQLLQLTVEKSCTKRQKTLLSTFRDTISGILGSFQSGRSSLLPEGPDEWVWSMSLPCREHQKETVACILICLDETVCNYCAPSLNDCKASDNDTE